MHTGGPFDVYLLLGTMPFVATPLPAVQPGGNRQIPKRALRVLGAGIAFAARALIALRTSRR